MPWSMEDYPASLKHLDKPVKKKAIEIANAMVDEGYDESRAIPIATSQAKEWADNRSKSELKSYAGKLMKRYAVTAVRAAGRSLRKSASMSLNTKKAGQSKPKTPSGPAK